MRNCFYKMAKVKDLGSYFKQSEKKNDPIPSVPSFLSVAHNTTILLLGRALNQMWGIMLRFMDPRAALDKFNRYI